ncbi:MAG: O-antigen ligase family protein, partial [Bacteroidales bacterium]
MRGMSLYMMLIIPLVLLFIDNVKKLNYFFTIWGLLSILASLKGIVQIVAGPDPWEQEWLSSSAGQTHIIWGQLRAFSFMSDAGQFGANQAYTAVVAMIVSIAEKKRGRKLFFLLVTVFGLIGMALSGTRGAVVVPLAGFAYFLILRKSGVMMISGMMLLLLVFVFFKFTYIGQGNTFIRRMRTAFNPDDPSLQVRLENQKKLRVYLATRPFGGGIGLAGVKAKAYLPDAFLSNIATDSWYVMIWAEQGIVGLTLHLFILFYILIKGSVKIMFRIRDPILKLKMSALASGMMGVMVASYGNAVLGTMPTCLLIYTSMALLLNSEKLDIQNI